MCFRTSLRASSLYGNKHTHTQLSDGAETTNLNQRVYEGGGGTHAHL